MNIFAILGEMGEVKSLLALWEKNKADNTALIDRTRALLGRIGVLDGGDVPAPTTGNPFAKYDTRWMQAALNLVEHVGLVEDGDAGPEGSKTHVALAAYQKKKGRKPDGLFGPIALGDLMQDLQGLEDAKKL